ncbi:MAG: hypothetical protein QOE58_3446 [Actinomycetota bacterium]|nr:hypothetical protein [Actinomycetota bacterium]
MVKKAVTWLAIAFAVFYLLTQPASAAVAVRSAGHALMQAADQIAAFFTNLAS